MKFTSFALLTVVMSTVVLAGCMGAKPTEEVMVDTGSTVEAVVENVTEEVVPAVTSGAEAIASGAEAVVNQVVNEVTTAQ